MFPIEFQLKKAISDCMNGLKEEYSSMILLHIHKIDNHTEKMSQENKFDGSSSNSEKKFDEARESSEFEKRRWILKRLLKSLALEVGDGTSMISLICSPREQISRMSSMLLEEAAAASNIKSRVNRQSVESAIVSAHQKLKLYSKVPKNGLAIFVGTVLTENGKEKKISIDFEPFRPINTTYYLCDNRFHTEVLDDLFVDNEVYGFIIIDGNGALFGKLQGTCKQVLHQFSVNLPKKHSRGGQSSVRFSRIRTEKRHNYIRKVTEIASQVFIEHDMPNIKGIILAGSADFKSVLSQSDLFDQRLRKIVLGLVDICYGGENGFSQAIELAQDILINTEYLHEKRVINRFFEQITQDTGKFCHGIDDTMKALEMGAVEMIIIWEELSVIRYVLKSGGQAKEEQERIVYLDANEIQDPKKFKDPDSGADLDIVDRVEVVEWIAQNHQKFGANLEFITDFSQEGSQFCKGFGGIGAVLRWKIEFNEEHESDNMVLDEEWSDFEEGF